MTAVGLCLPQLGPHVTGPLIGHFCARAEALGFSSLWVQEHLFHPHDAAPAYAGRPGLRPPDQYRSCLAPTETLAVAAACTRRVWLGTGVLVAGYHRPVELAQRLATLDLLSGGRLIAGFSVGWSDEEHRQMDVDPRTRGRRIVEMIAAVLACWGPDPVSHEGEFFSIPRSDLNPKPVQRPRPRLLSGMWSEAGLQRTATTFDIWNPVGRVADIVPVVERLKAMRPPHLRPLEIYHRVYVQSPVRTGRPPRGVPGVVDAVRQARRAGFEAVVIDASFWDGIDSPDAWAALPDLLRPALEAAAEPAGRAGGGRR